MRDRDKTRETDNEPQVEGETISAQTEGVRDG